MPSSEICLASAPSFLFHGRLLQNPGLVCCCLALVLLSCSGRADKLSFEDDKLASTGNVRSNGSGDAGNSGQSSDLAENSPDSLSPRLFVSELHECQAGLKTDSIQADSLRWDNDALKVEGSHSGGCEEHVYGLCYRGQLEGSVLDLTLTMLHDSGGDRCEAYFGTGPIEFDLQPVFEQFEAIFSQSVWTVNLVLQEQRLSRSEGGTRP